MADIMMILGPYPFGLDTAAFQELNRNTEWRWPSQDVFDSRPVVQFTGAGDDSITLPGVIFPEYWAGTGQLDALRALGDQGEPQTLIDGRGNVLGEWVITSVQERQTIFAQAGVGRRQEFTVALKRFDREVTSAATAAALITQATTATARLFGAAGFGITSAGQSVTGLTGMLSLLQTGLSGAQDILSAVGNALGAARSMQSAAREASAAIKALKTVDSLTTAQSAVSGLLSASSRAAQTATVSSAIIGRSTSPANPTQAALAEQAQIEVNKLAQRSTRTNAGTTDALRGFE